MMMDISSWLLPQVAEASSLGWTTIITTVTNEVRNIGIIVFGLALVLYGVQIAFSRRLEELGLSLSSYCIGGALIGTGVAMPAVLIGAAAAPLVGGPVLAPSTLEMAGDILGFWLMHGPLMVGVGMLYLWGRRRG